MASATPRTAPPNGRPRTIASGSATTRSPTTTPTSTPSQMRRSAPRTPAPRRSASRARPMLNKAVVTNVTVAAGRRVDDPRGGGPARRRQEHPQAGHGRESGAERDLRDAFVVEVRPVGRASNEGEPEKDPARMHGEHDGRVAPGPDPPRPPTGAANRSGATAIAITASSVRCACGSPRAAQRAKTMPASVGASEGEHREGRFGCPREALDQHVHQRDPGGLQQRSREQCRDALRRRVRAHRRSANRDQVDSRHSARRASAHGRSTRRPPVRTRRR